MKRTQNNRSQLGEFLRRHRERLNPNDLGLAVGRRRRTPGLRREEVAMLSDVSTEWYTRLEQGRNARASRETLIRIASALRLDASDRRHLLGLSGYGVGRAPEEHPATEVVTENLQHILDQLVSCPAYILGRRWDILAWNSPAEVVFGDPSKRLRAEQNILCEMFLGVRMKSMLKNWEEHAQGLLGSFRDKHASYLDDPSFTELIGLLCAKSTEFSTWWNDYEIKAWQNGIKHFEHPRLGPISFEHTAFDLVDTQTADVRLIVYVPTKDSDTKQRLLRGLAASVSP